MTEDEPLAKANARLIAEQKARIDSVDEHVLAIRGDMTLMRRENAEQHSAVEGQLNGLARAVNGVTTKLGQMDSHREKAKADLREERRLAREQATAEREEFKTEIVEIVKAESVIQADERLLEMRKKVLRWIRNNPIPSLVGGGAGGAVLVSQIIEWLAK